MMFPSVLRDTHLLPGRGGTEMGAQVKPNIGHPFKPRWFKYLFHIYVSDELSTQWENSLKGLSAEQCLLLLLSRLSSDFRFADLPQEDKSATVDRHTPWKAIWACFPHFTPHPYQLIKSFLCPHGTFSFKGQKNAIPLLLTPAVSELVALNLAVPANASCLIIQAWAQFGWKMAEDLHPSLLPACN